jgi:outer membrane protein insertion porin family
VGKPIALFSAEFTEVMKPSSKLIFVSMLATVGNVNAATAAPSAPQGLAAASSQLDLTAAASNQTASELVAGNAPNLDQPIALARSTKTKKKSKPRSPVRQSKPPAAAPVRGSGEVVDPAADKPAQSGKRVIVNAIDVQSANGQLSPELRTKVLSTISTKVGQPATSEQLQQDVNAIQALGAFQSVRVQPEQSGSGVKLTYLVAPFGVVRQVTIKTMPEGSSSVFSQAEIDNIFKGSYGSPLSATVLQENVKKLNQLYKERGYELAQVVNVENIDADGRLALVVTEGVIEDIKVRFLSKDRKPVDDKGQPIRGATREFIITREVELKPGKVYNRQTIGKDLRRIYGLGLFEDLGLSFAPSQKDPSKVILQIDVIERKTGSIVAGGGISSANGLFASLSYQEQNLGGNSQKLGGEVQLGTRELLFDVNLTDPWIAGDPNRTAYNINIFQRKSISLVFDGGPNRVYADNGFNPTVDPNTATNLPTQDVPRVVRTGGGITFTRPLNGDPYNEGSWRASAGVQYQKVATQDGNSRGVITAGGQPLTFSGTGEDDLLMVQLGLSQDLRNNPAEPTQGSLFRVGLDQSIPIGAGNIKMTRARGSFTQYIPTSFLNFDKGPQALVFNVQGGTVLGDLPPYEAFSLGGTTSVRGFDDGALGSGRSYVTASAEYRFPLFSIVGGTLFADYGTDLGTAASVPGNPAGLRNKPGSGFGYGAGVRINTGILGSLRLDFALNDKGDSRVQFGIGERF